MLGQVAYLFPLLKAILTVQMVMIKFKIMTIPGKY